MVRLVRPNDVCVHLLTNRPCRVVAGRTDGTVECVAGDGERFACRAADLFPCRRPERAASNRSGQLR